MKHALAVILMGASGDLKDLASNVRAFSNRKGLKVWARSFGVLQDDDSLCTHLLALSAARC